MNARLQVIRDLVAAPFTPENLRRIAAQFDALNAELLQSTPASHDRIALGQLDSLISTLVTRLQRFNQTIREQRAALLG